jgi:hypothetical protein
MTTSNNSQISGSYRSYTEGEGLGHEDDHFSQNEKGEDNDQDYDHGENDQYEEDDMYMEDGEDNAEFNDMYEDIGHDGEMPHGDEIDHQDSEEIDYITQEHNQVAIVSFNFIYII